MTRRATNRLLVAIIATVAGALFAALGGMPEAAVLVAPWAALLVLGLTTAQSGASTATVEITTDRLLVGDDVEVVTTVRGAAGSIHVKCRPSAGFSPRFHANDAWRAGIRDVFVSERAVVHSLVPAYRWGTHDVGHAYIEITEPYGLFRRGGLVGQPRQVRVHPTPTELQNLLAPWLVRRIAGAHSSKSLGRGVEYADIRPFAAGDSLREINWRASARSPELWVSQRHPDQATDVILLLDSFVESGHDAHAVVGLAIEAAVALAESHLAVTDRVGLVEMGGIVRWVRPSTGRIQLQRLTDSLLSTGLYANAAGRNLQGIPARVLPPRSFVVALTPLLDDRFIDALFVLAGRGHDVAVVECATEPAGDRPDSIQTRLVNRFWQADRQIVRDELAEHGIAVARWRKGVQLEVTLRELAQRRHRTVRASRR